MGQVLRGSARTTAAVRRAIQQSQESLNTLAERYGVTPKTVAKWKKRAFAHDAPMGPKEPASSILTKEEEAMCVAFRQHTLRPLDDCLSALQPTISHLSRSALQRCYQRHGISRLPDIAGDKLAKKMFKKYPIGYFHLDIAEVRTEEGKLYLFVVIDRTSKFACAEPHHASDRTISTAFRRRLIGIVPYKIHTFLTDNGSQFCHPLRYRNGPTAQWITPMFDRCYHKHGIEHRLTKPKHPWTNGQVERMNRTIKDATVKRYSYRSHDQLKTHRHSFLMAYNFARRRKTLKGLTPYEYIGKIWTQEPERFTVNPSQHTVELNK